MGKDKFSFHKKYGICSRKGLIIFGFWGLVSWPFWTAHSFAEEQASPPPRQAEEARLLVSIGDQLWEIGEQARAIEKYQEALKLSPLNVEATSRLVFSFQKAQYRLPKGLKNELGDQYYLYFLRLAYQLQAIEPKYRKDPKLLWEQVYFLEKNRETQKYAGEVLEALQELHPDDPEVLAKLGEFRVEFSLSKKEKERGIELINQAIDRNPKEPKYLQTLGEALLKIGKDAEAIRVYERATNVIEDDGKEALYEKRKFAVEGMQVFRQHAKKDEKNGILTPSLMMPLDERINVFEHFYYLIDPKESFHPYEQAMVPGERYLLTLYSKTDNIKKAEALLAKYYGGEGIGTQGNARFIEEDFTKNWIEILEKKSPESEVLRTLRATYEDKWGEVAPEKKDRN